MRFSIVNLSKRTFGHKLRYQSSERDQGFRENLQRNEYIFKPLPQEASAPTIDWNLLDPVDNDYRNGPMKRMREKKEMTSIPFDVTAKNRFEIISRVMCPLAHMPYEEQLKSKYSLTKHLMQEVGRKMRVDNNITVDSHGLPCPVDFPIASPRITEYRNKDEFSIWNGIDGNPKTVGFFVGVPSQHTNCIAVEPDELVISKKSHRILASLFQKYLREVSPYDTCFNFGEGGHWRRFVVRSNEVGEHMIVGQMHPQHLSQVEVESEMKRMKDFFTSPIVSDLNIASMYFQPTRGARRSHEEEPFQLISGKESLTETVLEKQFVLSPESFFQVNTLAAELLYQTIIEEVRPSKDMSVIDIGSGTGIIAISLAPHVKRVVGIEQSGQAVDDAKRNAQMNNVKNVTWMKGRVEDQLPQLLDDYHNTDVVVVANPGRGGLRSSVITMLREMEQVRKIVYVSCKPGGEAMKNFVHLSLKGNRRSPASPFYVTNVRPIDLFPQTGHSELILSFERFQ